MKKVALFCTLVCLYGLVIVPFTDSMRHRPFVEKMGFIPQPFVLKTMAVDHRNFVAALLVLKSMFYFGSMVDPASNKVNLPPDYPSMYQALTTALKLDPYTMDAYYFAQAFLVWDMGRVREANALLEYGMKYRTWDFYLPLFAGFNSAYFLKDYEKAALYYKRAGELSGSELYINLAGRYFYQSGQTDHAIAYLTVMEKAASNNDAVMKLFHYRLEALKEVKRIELARDAFRQRFSRLPDSMNELLQTGFLEKPAVDPYGGTFYLEESGHVASTSKFAFTRKGNPLNK